VYAGLGRVLAVLSVVCFLAAAMLSSGQRDAPSAGVWCEADGQAAKVQAAQAALVPSFLTEAGAQAGHASIQPAFQAAQAAQAVSVGAGFRYTGGGVTTSFTASSSAGLVAIADDQFLAGDSGPDGEDAVVFWWALLIMVCAAGLFLILTALREKRGRPHRKKH
jgi:hypothetical protein